MKLCEISDLLKRNTYPGRGIVAGLTPDAKYAAIAYFIMGRSVNSRNRVFVDAPDGGIITKAFDESKMSDPSLIIYSPIRIPAPDMWVVTNGDQTDTIAEFIDKGLSFEDALRTRTFEPDYPNWTPRISALVNFNEDGVSYKLSILKSADASGESLERHFWEYPSPIAGEARFLHTYKTDGEPIPSFEGEPEKVLVPNEFDEFTNQIWQSLNEDNKVSLFTAFVNAETQKAEYRRIINKNEQ